MKIKDQRGSAIILVACAMTVVIGMVALAVDLGVGFSLKAKLQHTADAAALAGSQELPWDTQASTMIALDYIEKNGVNTDSVNVAFSQDNTCIEVKISGIMDYVFAKVLGFTRQEIDTSAKAMNAPVTGMKGVKPLAVVDFPFNYGEQYVLKGGAGDGSQGNYGVLALGGTGSSVYEYNLIHGYNKVVCVGDKIPTETGNMATPTYRGMDSLIDSCNHTPPCTYYQHEKDCPRLIFLPIIDSLDISGRDNVTVVGFASFFIEDIQNEGGHTKIIGHFIRTVTSGEIQAGQKDLGVRSVKLVR
jgi:hypothetical protein